MPKGPSVAFKLRIASKPYVGRVDSRQLIDRACQLLDGSKQNIAHVRVAHLNGPIKRFSNEVHGMQHRCYKRISRTHFYIPLTASPFGRAGIQ